MLLYLLCLLLCLSLIHIFADLAQLVEQRIRNAEVEGSSPLIGTIWAVSYTHLDVYKRQMLLKAIFLLSMSLLE